MKKILVIRFSAMGDVVLTSPVIVSVLEQNPNLEIVFLSRPLFKDFFPNHNRLTFVGADLKGKHKGSKGLLLLKKELCKDHTFDAVIDLHDVLRTKLLRTYFKLSGHKTFRINKARKEKKDLISGKVPFNKLKHTTQRYLDVFEKAGFSSVLTKGPWLQPDPKIIRSFLEQNQLTEKTTPWIGIAPFAAHPSKEWGLNNIEAVIAPLLQNNKIFLFGGGNKEVAQLIELQNKYPEIILAAGNLKLAEELSIMGQLNVMLAMDSSNMHMATLVGIPVISIWGPTHHFLGFGPLNNEENIVEIAKEELPCRPCTVYGKLKSKEDEICAQKSMELIHPESVVNKINKVIHAK